MTQRLYYRDSFLYEFDAKVVAVRPPSGSEARTFVILDRTAFYPTSGGQTFDTGSIAVGGPKAQVLEVSEDDDGNILHLVEHLSEFKPGTPVHGSVNPERRRDHIQQHSGQHLLSAVFVRLFNMATLSFHMGDDYCSIDLDANAVSPQQIEAVERMCNEIILEDRPVEIRFASQEEARQLNLRKLPPAKRGELRLIDIRDLDLSACGGTHVQHTGQIGCVLLRKTEKVRQGIRVEFVCGLRAVRTARHDYLTLVEAGNLYSSHIWDVPQQIRKSQEEAKAGRRQREQMQEEIADKQAALLLADAPQVNGHKLVRQVFSGRDLAYIKLLAQKLTRVQPGVVALLGTTSPPSVIAAASPGQTLDMGAILKEVLGHHGGRGGGSKDMAQGGVPNAELVERVIAELAEKIR